MFEREAESYATRECCMTCNDINHFCKEKYECWSFAKKCECWTFAKKGAEFGYKKANEWHRQDNDDIYDFIAKDWSLKYFICIMKDKRWVTAIGICDEDYNGGVSTYLEFDYDDDKYSSDDLAWWKEIIPPDV